MSSKENHPRRSLRSTKLPPLSEAPSPALQAHSSALKPSHLQPHGSPPLPPASSSLGGLSTNLRSRKRRKDTPSPSRSADGESTPKLPDDSRHLEDAGIQVGAKTTRVRLVELLDKYVKTKRPRLTRNNKTSRIRSANEVRSKPIEPTNVVGAPPAGTQEVHQESALNDPFAPDDYDFNNLELPDLTRIVESIGLDGKTFTKAKMVVLCNQNRDLIRIPQHMFRFALQKPQPQALPTPAAGPMSHHQDQDERQPALIPSSTSTTEGSTPTGQTQVLPIASLTLPKKPVKAKGRVANIPPISRSNSPLSKQISKGKGRAKSTSPSESSERSPTAEPGSSTQIRPTDKDVLQNTYPSLEHRRFLYPRPNPTVKVLPTSSPKPTEPSDDEWCPPNDDKSSSDVSDGSAESPHNSTRHKPEPSRVSPLPSIHTQAPRSPPIPAPDVEEFDAAGHGDCQEEENESQWRFKYYQLKQSLAETNRKLDLVIHDLDVLSQVVSRFSDIKPNSSPDAKTRGGRSAHWMRIHIDTLLGHTKHGTVLPPPATDEDRAAWKVDVDLDNLDGHFPKSHEASPPTSDPSLLDSDGPRHPKATTQQLIVMRTLMRHVGVSRFCPDFSKSPSSAENRWLWDLAFRIFIKLVECGEYPGVSLETSNLKHLKKLLDTRVRSLMKQYQQESWAEARKKRAASAVRRRARLSYTKRLRERTVLSQKPLWPLSALIQAACSDDETDHEDCLHVDTNQPRTCHIRKLSWRSSELTETFILLDQYKAQLDASISKPRKQENQNSASSNGRPPRPRLRCPNPLTADHPAPSGLPIDCYSPQYLEKLTPFERSALQIVRKPLLSTLIPLIKSL